jgi:hypothetical protein
MYTAGKQCGYGAKACGALHVGTPFLARAGLLAMAKDCRRSLCLPESKSGGSACFGPAQVSGLASHGVITTSALTHTGYLWLATGGLTSYVCFFTF